MNVPVAVPPPVARHGGPAARLVGKRDTVAVTSYRDELDWAYHGEVIGEAMFATMAEAAGDPRRAAQLGLLALIERQTKEQLAPLLEREGIVRRDEPYEAKGRALGERANRPNWDWERFLRTFEPTTQPALVRYRSMRDQLAPAGDADQMRSLVMHEEVLQAFADALLGGAQDPARRLLGALEGEHRAQADKLLGALAD